MSSAAREGEVLLVEFESRRGETCRLRNPWGWPCDITERDGEAQVLTGEILQFDTKPGNGYRVLPQQIRFFQAGDR